MADAQRAIPYTELAMLVLARQSVAALDGVAAAHLSRRSLAKAADELRRLGRADLADEVEARRLNGRKRGQRLPAAGETRRYEVQQGGGLDFARIPTKPIGVERPGAVDTVFLGPEDYVEITTSSGTVQRSGPLAVVLPAHANGEANHDDD